MKSKVFITAVVITLILFGCKFFQQANKAKAEEPDYAMLDSAAVFNRDSVRSFEPVPQAIIYARKLFLNGVDLMVNKKDAVASLPVFLHSLRLNPDAETCLKYADALFKAGKISEAKTAYEFIEYDSRANNFKGMVNLGMARVLCAEGDSIAVYEELESAFNGYPFTKEDIMNDPAFAALHEKELFKILVAKHLDNEEVRLQKLFALFKNGFAAAAAPYAIGEDSFRNHQYASIDYRYSDFIPEMEDNQFSREVGSDYQFVAQLNISPAYVSIIYRAVDVLSDTMNPVHYYMMNIDTTGKVLGSKEIACYCSPLTIKTVAIDKTGTIEVKEILQTWKEDPIYKGYENNEVLSQEVKHITLYSTNVDGEIVEQANSPDQAQNNTTEKNN